MKKSIAAVLAAVWCMLLFAACSSGNENTYYDLMPDYAAYSAGAQQVTIRSSTPVNGDPAAVFRSGIGPGDILLSGGLEGMTVTGVTYKGPSEIAVELDGTAKMPGGEDVTGTITVRHTGMESSGNSACLISVLRPRLSVSATISSRQGLGEETLYSVRSTFYLPSGHFTDAATAEHIRLTPGTVGKLTVTFSDDKLTILAEDCREAMPSVMLDAAVTTFGKSITVALGTYAGVEI